MWQMGGVGPMAGQNHHFIKYAPSLEVPQVLPYAQDRYRNEVARLYGVLDRQLADNTYVAGETYSIADMALWPWVQNWEGQEQSLEDKPNLARWLDAIWERPAVKAGKALLKEVKERPLTKEEQAEVNMNMFGRR